MHINKQIIYVLTALLCPLQLSAQHSKKGDIEQLQTEMYRLFYTEDSLQFHEVVKDLMTASKEAGNEQAFYKAWCNDAIYQCTHQRRTQALQTAREIEEYAKESNSTYGQYSAIHTTGSVYHQMRDYDNAEQTFLRAADFLHKNAPDESAAADYIELALLSGNGKGDMQKATDYAKRALEEPGVSLHHRLRALTVICQILGDEYDEPDKEEFNKYYEQRLQVLQSAPPDRAQRSINWLYPYINGDYKKALALADSLQPDVQAFAKVRIYHKMGDFENSYKQMLAYKRLAEASNRTERQGLLSEYITQLANERVEAARREQEAQTRMWRNRFIYTFIFLLVIAICYAAYYLINRLHKNNIRLDKARQHEEEARHAEEQARMQAEKELDMKREFLNNIAQELRSPLNPITGFSDILADGSIELQAEERELMSQHIRENSRMLTGIIDNMLELSLYESKSSLPKDDTFSPNVVAQNAVDYGKTMLKEGVEIGMFSDIPDTLTIKSDLTAVGKVLRHLVVNASKYTDTGGITLNVTETDDGRIRFLVTDTGRGIPQEIRDHIFEPMTQGEGSGRQTSMGLAICARIAKLLGGSIELDATYKSGTRFTFEIPK